MLMIAYRLHFEEANMTAVRIARSGKIGDPRFFTSAFSMQVRPDNIRTDKEKGGGTLYDIGIYCINAARYLFGAEPTEVFAFSSASKTDQRFKEIDDRGAAALPRWSIGAVYIKFRGSRRQQLSYSGHER
jgi:predicted dehydrogenase